MGDDHPGNDGLEQYALGRLDPSTAASVENHLLVCDFCRERAAEIQAFSQAMRDALGDPLG
jgi:anti-sigma factor RsiW